LKPSGPNAPTVAQRSVSGSWVKEPTLPAPKWAT